MQSGLQDEGFVKANRKQRKRRNKKKKKQLARKSDGYDETVDHPEEEVAKTAQEAFKETTQQPSEELLTSVTETDAQNNCNPTEVKNPKKRRKRHKRKKRAQHREEFDSGFESPIRIDYSGPNGQLFLVGISLVCLIKMP